MVKFYVFTSAKDEFEFVEEPAIEHFAAYEFDPASMSFSGIAIEADDFDMAMRVYQNPACGDGEYMLADEPLATATRRQIFESTDFLEKSHQDIKEKLQHLRACLKLKMALMKMHEANTLLNEASHLLLEVNNKFGVIQPDVVFQRLSDAAIKQAIKYNGDTTKD